MDNKLYLGVAESDITPEVGGNLYGYYPDIYSESVNDNLTATAFYFTQGDTKVLMVTATVCLINTNLAQEVISRVSETYDIPKSNIILSATHTHSGPNVSGTVGWGDIDRKYCDSIFIPRIMDAVKKATEKTVPVKMGIATGDSLVGINRRERLLNNEIELGQCPWGPFDPKMTILSFKGEDGKIVANIIHYGAHGTASGINHEITRDWSGVMTDKLAEITGGVTAFFNGPEGDVGPRLTNGKTIGEHHARYAMELGSVAAQDAMRIYNTMHGYHTPKLDAITETLDIPLTKRISLEDAKAEFAKWPEDSTNSEGARRNYLLEQIELYENGYVDKEFRSIPQTIIRLGDVIFITFPYELFSEIGMRIAQGSNFAHTLSLSNSNGSEGYFATENEICLGGYEIDMFKTAYIQPYADNADWHVITQTLKNVDKLKGE